MAFFLQYGNWECCRRESWQIHRTAGWYVLCLWNGGHMDGESTETKPDSRSHIKLCEWGKTSVTAIFSFSLKRMLTDWQLCERLPSPLGESAVDCGKLSSMPKVSFTIGGKVFDLSPNEVCFIMVFASNKLCYASCNSTLSERKIKWLIIESFCGITTNCHITKPILVFKVFSFYREVDVCCHQEVLLYFEVVSISILHQFRCLIFQLSNLREPP